MFEEFAGKGSVVKYINQNGSDSEREQANKVLREGQELIVEDISIGNWYSHYYFAGFSFPFNTVMFEIIEQKPVLLESWFITDDNRLRGIVGGYLITTSEIEKLDKDAGFCKTKNSLYHLGKPRD
jgi:hypothetical protein